MTLPSDFQRLLDELHVFPIINAGGFRSQLGGARLNAEDASLMMQAAQYFFDIPALNKSVGGYIAEVTKSEAGMVTSCAASGVVLATAACIAGKNMGLTKALPNLQCRKNILIQRAHYSPYSYLFSMSGAHLREVGSLGGTHRQEVEVAIDGDTVALAYIEGEYLAKTGMRLEDYCSIAHSHNLPVIVDAATMLPPKSNLTRYIECGADLVSISGGKYIGGPQASGLLFGRRDLIDAAMLSSSPNHGIGRPHKVSRESIIGLYLALKRFVEEDEEERIQAAYKQIQAIETRLRSLDNIQTHVERRNNYQGIPVLVVTFKNNESHNAKLVHEELLTQKPSIYVMYDWSRSALIVNPANLISQELKLVAERLHSSIDARRTRNAQL